MATSPPIVFIVLDHEDYLLGVFASREAAEGYIAREWADLPGREILWHVEEREVRDV